MVEVVIVEVIEVIARKISRMRKKQNKNKKDTCGLVPVWVWVIMEVCGDSCRSSW